MAGTLDESGSIVASEVVDILPVLSVLENIDVIRLALLNVDNRLDQPVVLFDPLVVAISKSTLTDCMNFRLTRRLPSCSSGSIASS